MVSVFTSPVVDGTVGKGRVISGSADGIVAEGRRLWPSASLLQFRLDNADARREFKVDDFTHYVTRFGLGRVNP